jgi:hypothetical protein
MGKKKKKIQKTTPEERARWQENQDRLERIIARRLAEEGVTREEAIARLSNPRA